MGSIHELIDRPDNSTMLFLPLAHSFARIIEVGCLEAGAILGHWPDTTTLTTGLPEFQPTFLLAVPRVFEKVFNSAKLQASAARPRAGYSTPRRTPRSPGVSPWTTAGPALASGCGMPCSTGSSTAS